MALVSITGYLGVAIYNDGKIYEGNFEANEKCGFGYEIYPNGNVYIGWFEKNKKHGIRSFYWFNLSNCVPSNHQ
jgi:hypothetical protein